MTNEERAILDLMDDDGKEWISLDEDGYVLGVDRDVLADRIRSLLDAAVAAERARIKSEVERMHGIDQTWEGLEPSFDGKYLERKDVLSVLSALAVGRVG